MIGLAARLLARFMQLKHPAPSTQHRIPHQGYTGAPSRQSKTCHRRPPPSTSANGRTPLAVPFGGHLRKGGPSWQSWGWARGWLVSIEKVAIAPPPRRAIGCEMIKLWPALEGGGGPSISLPTCVVERAERPSHLGRRRRRRGGAKTVLPSSLVQRVVEEPFARVRTLRSLRGWHPPAWWEGGRVGGTSSAWSRDCEGTSSPTTPGARQV